MKASAIPKAKALATKLLRGVSRVASPVQRSLMIERVLYETHSSLPSVYRLLLQRGYSMSSALENAYGAYLSYAKDGMGDEDDDFEAFLDQLATQGTSGDSASTQTTAQRTQEALDIINTALQAGETIVDIGGQIYDMATGQRVTTAPKPAETTQAPTLARVTPYSRALLQAVRPRVPDYSIPPPADGGTSPMLVALGVAGAVLVGYALFGKKSKKR